MKLRRDYGEEVVTSGDVTEGVAGKLPPPWPTWRRWLERARHFYMAELN